MSMSDKTAGDLVRIAAAGGSLELEANKTPGDFVRIAAAIESGGGHLTLVGASRFTPGDMVRIASAAPGKVTFKD
ncbi:hypothetical protein [Pseudomonas amygdali]|uniref:hypothetical protein n=1 Tax=Pseudomonas amygdali TaxID=47877 RepID=UPI0009BEF7E1|nr:hypothetical protein [Pseudomonas amygdali]